MIIEAVESKHEEEVCQDLPMTKERTHTSLLEYPFLPGVPDRRDVVEARSPLIEKDGDPLLPGFLPAKGGQIEIVVRRQEYIDATSSG